MSAILVTVAKALGTALVVILISEIAKRSSFIAAMVAALPLMTILVVANLALDPKAGITTANAFANTTFLLFWPGLVFFVGLFLAQRFGASFWVAFAIAVPSAFLATWGATVLYKAIGLKL
jgi:hypothetical protein